MGLLRKSIGKHNEKCILLVENLVSIKEQGTPRFKLPDGELYAAYSPERAELLRYAFKQAGDSGSVNWKYIEGIYDNFEKRCITNVEEAIQKEYAWKRGEVA